MVCTSIRGVEVSIRANARILGLFVFVFPGVHANWLFAALSHLNAFDGEAVTESGTSVIAPSTYVRVLRLSGRWRRATTINPWLGRHGFDLRAILLFSCRRLWNNPIRPSRGTVACIYVHLAAGGLALFTQGRMTAWLKND